MKRISSHKFFYLRRYFRLILLLAITELMGLNFLSNNMPVLVPFLIFSFIPGFDSVIDMKSYVYDDGDGIVVKSMRRFNKIPLDKVVTIYTAGSDLFWKRLNPLYIVIEYKGKSKENEALKFVTNKYFRESPLIESLKKNTQEPENPVKS